MKKTCCFCFCFILLTACSRNADTTLLDTGKSVNWITSGSVHLSPDCLLLKESNALAFTKKPYKNFQLDLECKTDQGAIGGIWFHNPGSIKKNEGYEVLINNNAEAAEWRKTGGLTAIRNFAKRVADNDQWIPVRIEVKAKQICVSVNNILITDYTEPQDPYRDSLYAERKLSEGVFLFVNYGTAGIAFRNIRIQALPGDLSNPTEAVEEQADDIIRLQQQNFPLIDYHLHLKGGWTKEQAAANSRKYGITYGIAPNCGKDFPITDDSGIYHWIDTMQHTPFLLPMQAEGREWVGMFSSEAIAKFDYRFTDAMTWTDDKGRRMRIWIPEETFIDDKQHFMEMLVDRACGIISNEPIDIYVNPTFIPDKLMPEYDKLWTPARMQKIIDACAEHKVAVEINNHYKIPSESFINQAKAAGVKFTFGTNNSAPADVGRLEYAIEMIKKCGLTPNDLFIPSN
ncbi:MAG: DUF1080 domain-containing protein [Dysgonamonadaceae bacterium]|nr:DUF1080 domain-containing protein [Dysgonamonadaceae bacterium]